MRTRDDLIAEIHMLRSHLSKSDRHMIDYKLALQREGDAELEIRRLWNNEVAALNLVWAKRLAQCRHNRENPEADDVG